jgi:hypothetical protein
MEADLRTRGVVYIPAGYCQRIGRMEADLRTR